MKLLLKEHIDKMLDNGRASAAHPGGSIDAPPVVKLFTPDGGATWLLSELDPQDPDLAFGLCDMGIGTPELGSVRISEIEQIRGAFRLPVERDQWAKFDKPMSAYATQASKLGRIDINF
jgi:hypothetical protein